MLEGGTNNTAQNKDRPTSPQGVLDPVPSEERKYNKGYDSTSGTNAEFKTQKKSEPLQPKSSDHPIWGAVAELGLKGTTDRTGGEGKVLDGESSRQQIFPL